ncbi:hypothetical protein C0991_002781 [Blastosporella zonata]|nr:hypothetical protein C0991_002781 [Blastosporella zonata]
MVLLSFAFQPLSAALLVVVNTWIQLPGTYCGCRFMISAQTLGSDVTLNNLGAIGLNQDPQFQDLTTFVTAAGFASASVLYNLPDPAFIHDQYTIAPFEVSFKVHFNQF